MNKKGFTLIELVVSMSVTAIALAMVVALVIGIDKSYNKSNTNVAVMSDLVDVRDTINNWFYAFDSTEFDVSCTAPSSLIFKNTSTTYSITFADKTLTYSTQTNPSNLKIYQHINSITFEYDETIKIAKTIVDYSDNQKLTFIMQKKSI